MADEERPARELGVEDRKEAEKRSALGVHIVHEAIRLEGEEELRRPISGLAWSGIGGRLPRRSRQLPHSIAGCVETLYAVTRGEASPGQYLLGFLLPAFLGNAIGGVSLVAALNHAQVAAGAPERA